MTKLFVAAVIMTATLFAGGSLGIATGSTQGTYFAFGNDIKSVCGDDLDINVIETEGSVDNVKQLLSSSKVQIGLAQADALTAMNIRTDNALEKKIAALYPLYEEQIHIFTRKGETVKKFSDLNGKSVAVGSKESGRNQTHSVLDVLLDLEWKAKYSGSLLDDLKGLLNFEYDAVLYVAGAPTKLLSRIGGEDRIQLNSIYDSGLDEYSNLYHVTTIPAGTYSRKFQKGTIDTYGIDSLLIAYNYKKDGASYPKVAKLHQCLEKKLSYLKRTGMPQWKDVNLNADMDWKTKFAQ